MNEVINEELIEIGNSAKRASKVLITLTKPRKNEALLKIAEALIAHTADIIYANDKDIEKAKAKGTSEAMIDRLKLTEARIEQIAEGIRQVAALDDPVGEVLSMKETPNGLMIGQKRVPLGVVAIIYESRPNVTADAFALCFKTCNAVILKGGSDALNSNMAIVRVIRETLLSLKISPDAISLIESTDHEAVNQLCRMNKYVDVIIPRGGSGLIKSVVNNSTVPVIETGVGNCHIYVDRDADLSKAIPIIHNAKLQRLGVCNACESLVVHSQIADRAIPMIAEDLAKENCEIRGDEESMKLSSLISKAVEEDYGTEYLAKIISVKIVDSLDEAIEHINKYSTGHSEAIITENYSAAMQFENLVDSAAVYVNASTRFTDGFEFGFGAEIGISTQKLHARGPMGLKALTTTKFIIFGTGQIRE